MDVQSDGKVILEVDDVFSLRCPNCRKGKLSSAKHYKQGTDGNVRVYKRFCNNPQCGAEFDEEKYVRREMVGSSLGKTPYIPLS